MTRPEVLAELSPQEHTRELDLEEARSIQELMLPGQALHTGRVTITHAFQPAAEVGGDFLDYFSLTDGTVGVYLGDVCGKGLPAALYAALAVGTLRGVHKTGQSPAQVINMLNRRLTIRGNPRRYAAMQYAVCDPQTGCMQIASAGMSGPIHISRSGCTALQLSGIPPGMLAQATYDSYYLQLAPGDSVLFFSDGLFEAVNSVDESFGVERLVEVCNRLRAVTSAEFLARLFTAVRDFAHGFEQQDDMAAAIFHFADPAAQSHPQLLFGCQSAM